MTQYVKVVEVPAGHKGPICGRCKEPLKGRGIVRTLCSVGMVCEPCYQEIRQEIDQIVERAIAEGRHTVPPAAPRRPS